MSKRFIGAWVDEKTRKKLQIACVVHEIYQQDVIELLIKNWVDKPHVQEEIKDLINGRKENNG